MEELVIVKHCEKIICTYPPEVCPLCGEKIDYSVVEAPSHLPNPFTNAHIKNCRLSIVIKPTTGTWNSAVKSENDLHIGVTDLSDSVVNYWWSGVIKDLDGWNNSLVAYQVSSSELYQWDHVWVSVLNDLEEDPLWSANHYNEDCHNCFDFVVEFLMKFCTEVDQRLGYVKGLDFVLEQRQNENLSIKEAFAECLVLPKLMQATNYIHHYDKVKTCGYSKMK